MYAMHIRIVIIIKQKKF